MCNFHATFAKDKLSVSLSSISFSWSWKQNLCKFFRKLVFNSLCSICLSHIVTYKCNSCSSCLMCQFIFIMSRALCTFDLNIKRSSFFIGPSQLPILCTSCDATYYKTLQLFLSLEHFRSYQKFIFRAFNLFEAASKNLDEFYLIFIFE